MGKNRLEAFSDGVVKWMGENHFATWPTVLYDVNLLAAGADVMVRAIHRVIFWLIPDRRIEQALGTNG